MKNNKAMKIHEWYIGLLHTMKLLWIAPASKDEEWYVKPQMTVPFPNENRSNIHLCFDTVMMET